MILFFLEKINSSLYIGFSKILSSFDSFLCTSMTCSFKICRKDTSCNWKIKNITKLRKNMIMLQIYSLVAGEVKKVFKFFACSNWKMCEQLGTNFTFSFMLIKIRESYKNLGLKISINKVIHLQSSSKLTIFSADGSSPNWKPDYSGPFVV